MRDYIGTLEGSHPAFAAKVRAWATLCLESGYEIQVICAALSAASAYSPHGVVTTESAPAALAVEAVLLNPHGKPLSSVPASVWAILGQMAEACGLETSGVGCGDYNEGDGERIHLQEPGIGSVETRDAVLAEFELAWPV